MVKTPAGFREITSREKKFRAWDGEKMMFFGLFNDMDCGLLIQRGESIDLQGDGTAIMDFVGKDSLEADMYDGDIVKLTADSYSEKLGKCHGEWITCVHYSEEKRGFVLSTLKKNEYDSALTWGFDERDFNGHPFKKRVIGNIFKDAGLLKTY